MGLDKNTGPGDLPIEPVKIISRIYTSTFLTRVKYNPGQNNPGYICVASTHDIPHARARHCDGGKRSRNRYFNLSML